MKKCAYSYNLMLKKTPYHIISEQKSTPIPAAHPYTDTYRKLPPTDPPEQRLVSGVGRGTLKLASQQRLGSDVIKVSFL